MNLHGTPAINLARSTALPWRARLFFGALETKWRSRSFYKDRVRYLPWANLDTLPALITNRKAAAPANVIWQYWDKGADAAPEVVAACFRSVEQYCGTHPRVILSDQDAFDYVDLPDHIVAKWNHINPTKRSNILRLALLSQHGGMWIDSTCFLSGPIPEDYFSAEFVAFTNPCDDRLIRTWFMAGQPGNVLALSLLRMHYMFYLHSTQAPCYFFFHYMFENLVTMESAIRGAWVRCQVDAPPAATDLQGKDTAPERYGQILRESWIHKLSWRMTPSQERTLLPLLGRRDVPAESTL